MARVERGAASSTATKGRRSFLEKRAASEPGIRAAKAALDERRAVAQGGPSPHLLGAFELLYQSKDGRLCLFQARDGHLSSVDGLKLA